MRIANSVIVANWAEYYGGAIAGGASELSIDSSTINSNRAGLQAGGVLANAGTSIRNSILWNNSVGWPLAGNSELEQVDGLERAVVSHNLIEGWTGQYGGAGNDSADPLFVDPSLTDAHGRAVMPDLRLLPDSPARDSGDTELDALPGESDLDGKPRVLCGRIDRGAYEYGLAGDVNCDQRVDGADFGRWAECESGPQPEPLFLGDCGPLDGHADGRIDLHDFAVFQNIYEAGD